MKDQNKFFEVIIVGGGLAGLCNAIHLSKFGKKVLLIEKNEYPKHKVCGEYISNEVLPYLNFLEIDPFKHGAITIENFELSTIKNELISTKLPLGGFGISRFQLDYILAKKAKENQVEVLHDTVLDIYFSKDIFLVKTKENNLFKANLTIGSYGKRSLLDIKLERNFIQKKSPYLAVKTHVKVDFKKNLVALHNFKGGYCGVSMVEDNIINLCYITSFTSFKEYKNINEFQEKVVFKNQYLKEIFKNSKAVFKNPLTISQVSFETKKAVEDHILMCGDAAGMIHPLCGNGMSMAIQSAQIASKLILSYLNNEISTRQELEKRYIRQWKRKFSIRLKMGHFIAMLFRQHKIASFLLQVLKIFPFLLPLIIKFTHGNKMKL